MSTETGCGNNPCTLRIGGESGGIRTQGSCRCLDGISLKQRIAIIQTIHVLRRALAIQAKQHELAIENIIMEMGEMNDG